MEHKIIARLLVGSQAQGTSTPDSDFDYKNIYQQNNDDILSYGYKEFDKVSKDETSYEVKRFLDLLIEGKPEALEILFSPDDCIILSSPQFELLRKNKHKFLTKKCYATFSGYAKGQLIKAKGLDKKINWSKEKTERKEPIDFCYIQVKEKTLPIKEFLEANSLKQENCGLVNLNHFDNCYAMYYDYSGTENFRGIIGQNSNEVRLSPVSKEFAEVNTPFIITYNKDKYSRHCNDYKSYCVWLKERNTNRYHTNKSHGQIYDSKNISHAVRIISIGKEIALTGTFSVRRPNTDYLLSIKRGDVPLDKIIEDVEKDILGLEELYKNSNLPDEVDFQFVKDLLLQIRKMN